MLNLGTPAKNTRSRTRTSLGDIGFLYDARNDRCTRQSVITGCSVDATHIEFRRKESRGVAANRASLVIATGSQKRQCLSRDYDFLALSPRVEEHARTTKPTPVNILLLGETGAGKSTFINGFYNYTTYPTIGQAKNSDSACLIPTKFTMTNRKFKEFEIKTGTHANEVQQVGRSSTQMPTSYVFRRGSVDLRIIDTPGIGDTHGMEHDRVNFHKIVNYLTKFDEIHGICILMKPNNARLSATFKFCIKELLMHFHRDACKNIVFCFTNARGTFYQPGDTLPALRELIASSTDIDLPLCRETIYCIDNESVRFLAALKQGVKFTKDEKKNYSTSWETSLRETERLINYISSLPPHKVKNTLTLNNARRLVLVLGRPLAQITSTIQNSIGVMKQRRQREGVDQNVERQSEDEATNSETNERHMRSLEDCIKALEAEKRQVAKVSTKFACFLKHSAIAPYNDAISDYLDHLIEHERGKKSTCGNWSKLVRLEKMKSMYEEELMILEKAINDSKSDLNVPSVEEIMMLHNDLCRLHIGNPLLKDAMKVVESADIRAMEIAQRDSGHYRL